MLVKPQLLSVIVVHWVGYWNPFVQKPCLLRQDVTIFHDNARPQPGLLTG